MQLETKQIKSIIDRWSYISSKAHKNYDSILSTDDLKKLTVEQLQNLIEYSKSFILDMENLFCDYRHLIGMVNLRVADRSRLTSLFIDITSFRPDAKRISQYCDIMNLKFVPTQSKYILKLNPDISLLSDLRKGQKIGEIIDESDHLVSYIEDDGIEIKQVDNDKIDVSFRFDHAIQVRKLFGSATKQTDKSFADTNLDLFKGKLDSGKVYGFNVTESDGIYTVHLTDVQDKLPIYEYFKKRIK